MFDLSAKCTAEALKKEHLEMEKGQKKTSAELKLNSLCTEITMYGNQSVRVRLLRASSS